jgi:hypothetical protein
LSFQVLNLLLFDEGGRFFVAVEKRKIQGVSVATQEPTLSKLVVSTQEPTTKNPAAT